MPTGYALAAGATVRSPIRPGPWGNPAVIVSK